MWVKRQFDLSAEMSGLSENIALGLTDIGRMSEKKHTHTVYSLPPSWGGPVQRHENSNLRL